MKAFERDAPWLYMNRKREISIPALVIFDLIKRKYSSECFQKQSPGSVSKKKLSWNISQNLQIESALETLFTKAESLELKLY